MSAPRPYDVSAPLVPGISLLEASAGTGKTYQITNLVLRLVTEPEHPVRMGELLVVTFTKAATAELIDRIRDRLAQAVKVYRHCAMSTGLEGVQADSDADESLQVLLRAAAASGCLELHLERLVRAQEEFDQALISTMHGFCQRMLKQNAFESLVDFDLELVQDQSEILEELVDDYLSSEVNMASRSRRAFLVDDCGFTRAELFELAKAAVQDPRMTVDPDPRQPLAPRNERLTAFADWWELEGMAELAAAFDQACLDQEIVPAKGRKSQSTYVSKKCTTNGMTLLGWVRGVIAGTETGGCPQANYWTAKNIKGFSAGHEAWYHPHLGRVRRAMAPELEEAAHQRARFVQHARAELEKRHRAQRTMNFHDLLRLLAEQLEKPGTAASLHGAIAPSFRAALIDEFQDTDPEQWTIFRTLFGDGQHHLFLIGDPKQAIYGFRGANVNVYLQAKASAGQRWSMATNYRSDARFLAALNPVLAAPCPPDVTPPAALEREGMFGLTGIAYEPVSAPKKRDPSVRLHPAEGGQASVPGSMAPLQLRFLDARSDRSFRDDGSADTLLDLGVLNALLPGRVAADIVDTLQQGQLIHDAKKGGLRALSPGDIAVLVRSNRQAKAVQRALLEAGVPCVLPGADSVFVSDEARDLQLWLEAVQSPGSESASRAAITTPMFGVTAAKLRSLDDEAAAANSGGWWDSWLGQLARWQGTLEKHGVLRAFRAAMVVRDIQTRLLAWPDGERRLTNLQHLLELLHAAQVQDHLQLSGLIRWLSGQRRSAKADTETGELRLERDDAAVRILTLHKAKGLQFPVVFVPYSWGKARGGGRALVVSKQTGSPERVLDVHLDAASDPKRARTLRAVRESWQDELRLLYVAVTRAEQRCVLYAGHIKDMATSAIGTLLHAFPPGTPSGAVGDRLDAARARIPKLSSDDLWRDLVGLAASVGELAPYGPGIRVSRCEPVTDPPRWTATDPKDRKPSDLKARVFQRRHPDGEPKGLDHTWRRASYTSLTKGRSHREDAALEQAAGALGVVSEQQATGKDHDQEAEGGRLEGTGLDPATEAALRAALPTGAVAQAEVPLAGFPAGADAGSFLHELFEHLDFTPFAHSDDDAEGRQAAQAELLRVVKERGSLHGFDTPKQRELLLQGIPAVLRSPLGGELGDLRLADIPKQRRLDELVFDLPLAGGDDHRRPDADGTVRFTERISGLEFGQAFLLGKGDPVLRDVYLDKLARGWENQRFAGYLTGSIDLVFATPTDPEQTARRFYVLDYKSNRLDLLRERKTTRGHFCQAWMRHEMEHHDYVVQATLYSLALHRFLYQRLRGYEPSEHLGGALYLFLRGMAGPERPPDSEHPYGVFFLRPDLKVIQRLDALFEAAASDGGRP